MIGMRVEPAGDEQLGRRRREAPHLTGNAIGVYGSAVNNAGVFGSSTNQYGVLAYSSNSNALVAQAQSALQKA